MSTEKGLNQLEQSITFLAPERDLRKAKALERKAYRTAKKMFRYVIRNVKKGIIVMPARTRRGPSLSYGWINEPILLALNKMLAEVNLEATSSSKYVGCDDTEYYLHISIKKSGDKKSKVVSINKKSTNEKVI